MIAEAKRSTYEDVEQMLHKLAHRSGIFDHEEAYQEACLAFCEAYDSYDPSQSRFTTWCYWQARTALLEKRIGEARHSSIAVCSLKAVEQATSKGFDAGRHPAPLASLLEDLRGDARIVVEIILSGPEDILNALTECSSMQQRCGVLRTYLRGLGWTLARITESFSEIRDALR